MIFSLWTLIIIIIKIVSEITINNEIKEYQWCGCGFDYFDYYGNHRADVQHLIELDLCANFHLQFQTINKYVKRCKNNTSNIKRIKTKKRLKMNKILNKK